MSMSNPMHHVQTSNTKRSAEKEKRSWDDLQHEKKAYLKRRQEDEEADKAINNLKRALEEEDDDTALPF